MISHPCRCLCQGILLIVIFAAAASAVAVTDPLQRWIGSHSRLVWVQDHGRGNDPFTRSRNLMLYGYDSRDGKGERPLLAEKDNYFKPFITPDGESVIYSHHINRQIYQLDWRTGKRTSLGEGIALAAWEDPTPSLFLRRKTTWIYCLYGKQPEVRHNSSQPLYRFPLNNPKKKELVWDRTPINWNNIQLSRDGSLLSGLFPWPNAGVLRLDDGQWQRFGKGCWTSLSPDNSQLLWIFDGPHRNVQIHEVRSGKQWQVNINGAPGIGGWEVYHPRWSNHPRYFVMTGPYEKGEGGNRISDGGEKVEIHIGRFDEKIRRVEAWHQVTRNRRADFVPDLWVAGGDRVDLFAEVEQQKAIQSAVEEQRAAQEHLVFLWEDLKAANQLPAESPVGFFQSNLQLRGSALHSRHLQLATGGGWAETGEAGKKIGAAVARSGEMSLEFLFTPVEGHQGEILSLATDETPLVALSQDDTLFQVLSPSGAIPLLWPGLLEAGKPHHLTLNFDGKGVEIFLDGKGVGRREITLDLATQPIDRFVLGDPQGGWHGLIEGIAVYNRLLSAEEITANFDFTAGRVAGRTPLPGLVVTGRLEERTTIPDPDSLGAYSRALVVNSYAVERVEQGVYQQERIVVAEWAVLDREIVKKYQDDMQSERLVLEKFSDHPELEGERQLMDIFEPDLELYYRLPPAFAGQS